jgi:acyl carrier protein
MKTQDQIARFIESELLEGDVLNVDPLDAGMLDSLALEALVTWIEEKLGITFSDEDLVAENFASVSALAAFVDAKRSETKDPRRKTRRSP